MKNTKLAAIALMAAMTGSLFTATAFAADGVTPDSIEIGTPVFTEDFDSADSITVDEILGSQKGWTTSYADNNAYSIGTYVGQGTAFGEGNVLNARMNSWCLASKSMIDIKDNAVARGSDINWDANKQMVLSLDFIFDPAYLDNVGNLQNGAEGKVKIFNDYSNELINIDARMYKGDNNADPNCKITIDIINEGQITYITDTDFSSNANKVYNTPYNLKVYRDGDVYGGKILITINDEVIPAPDGGDWHTINGSVNIQKIELENWWTNWYGGISVDNIELAPWSEKQTPVTVESVAAEKVIGENANEIGVYGDYNYAAAFKTAPFAIEKVNGSKYTWVVDNGTNKYAQEYDGAVLSGEGEVVMGLVVTDITTDSDLSAILYLGTLEDTKTTIQAD